MSHQILYDNPDGYAAVWKICLQSASAKNVWSSNPHTVDGKDGQEYSLTPPLNRWLLIVKGNTQTD